MKKYSLKKLSQPGDHNVVTPLYTDRRPSTKELLIEVGERLFGRHGFDGVSLREIATEAGQSNANVVQYHYGDKAGLISAILEDRVARIETVRAIQLAMLDKEVPPTPKQLVKILWLPLMSITGATGDHPFCRFMLQYMLHPKLISHPLAFVYRSPFGGQSVEGKLASVQAVVQLLFTVHANIPEEIILKRIAALATLFLASVVEHDNHQASGEPTAAGYDIDPIIDMAVAALSAPV